MNPPTPQPITITINVIEFTAKAPTQEGAYWNKQDNCSPVLVEVASYEGTLVAETEYGRAPLATVGGLWSTHLVPAQEVESAWRESWKIAFNDKAYRETAWATSRARRITQGEQA